MPANCLKTIVLVAAMFIAGLRLAVAGPTISTQSLRHLFDITSGAGALAMPSDVAVGSNGRIYVVDGGNNRVAVFGSGGQYLFSIGRAGSGRAEFRGPVGIGTDSSGRFYVADSGNHRIQIFDGEGVSLGGFPVSSGGEEVRPIDVAPNADGSIIYVTGNNNHKVMAYSPSGQLLHEWGGHGEEPGEFRYPASIMVSPAGMVYVVDVFNTRVQVFEGDGQGGYRIGRWGVTPGHLFRPKGVAMDSRGCAYVSDSYMNVIQVFDPENHFLDVLGEAGKPHYFTTPTGIMIDANDKLYVVEMLANKVSVYALH